MSDKRLVEINNCSGKRMNTAVVRSRRYLVALTAAHHRGPADTWTAARDRAAKAAGIERSYAARIWSRWQDMQDVSGEAFMRLLEAYEELCAKSEAAEAAQRAEGERIARETADEIMAAAALYSRRERVGRMAAEEIATPPRAVR